MDMTSYLLGKKSGGGGTSDYSELSNKPSINNVTLSGNKTTSDLGLFSGDYADLSNKPEIIPILDVATRGDQSAESTDNATTLQNASKIINDFYSNGTKYGAITFRGAASQNQIGFNDNANSLDTQRTSYSFYNLLYVSSDNVKLGRWQINGTWSNNIFTATMVYHYIAYDYYMSQFMTKSNTSAYSVTSDYNPAHKKYVDDAIASAITDALGGSY